MRRLLFITALTAALPATPLISVAGDAGAFVEEPNPVLKITEAIVSSKTGQLQPGVYEEKGKKFSYHLKSVSYLGTIEHGQEKMILGTALFLRSSAKGSEYPPARGHGFLVCLTPDFKLKTYCRLDFPDVELSGTKLMRGDKVIAEFANSAEIVKRQGYLIEGDDFLGYPFSDRLSDSKKEGGKK